MSCETPIAGAGDLRQSLVGFEHQLAVIDAKLKTPSKVGRLEPKFQTRTLDSRLRGKMKIGGLNLTPRRRFELHRSGRIKPFALIGF